MTKTKIVALLSIVALLASLPLTVALAQGALYLNQSQGGMCICCVILSGWVDAGGSSAGVAKTRQGRPHPNPLPKGEGTAHSTVVLV